MMECHRDPSAKFLAGGMSDAEVLAFEEHVAICPECQDNLDQATSRDGLLLAMRRVIPAPSSRTGLHRLTGGESSRLSANGSGPWSPQYTTATVLALLAPSDDPQIAGRLGQYDILGIVGRGSAGIVLKGFDRSLHRNIAIKILDPALADVSAARVRFGREAKAMASVSCDHVVPIFEVSEHAGLPYFVMEYVPGGSLERRLHEGEPIDVVATVRIGMQVALALAAAHAQGLVHRDIKPGNILLDPGTERVRVADFGLARAVNDASCTRSGFVTGTPQYMSPEQVRGEQCDGLCDLFSLGAVMYALCTGHPPFQADSVYAVMQCVVHEQPCSIRKQNPAVPDWLEDLIFRLLSKHRSGRFESAAAVAELLEQELAHLQDSRAVAPQRPWRRRNLARLSGRRSLLVVATIFTIFSVVVTTLQLRGQKLPTDNHPARLQSQTSGPAPEASQSRGNQTQLNQTQVHQPQVHRNPTNGNSGQHARLPPLWGHDGTSELQAEVKRLRNDWTAPSHDVSGTKQQLPTLDAVRQRISTLKHQLQVFDPLSAVPAPQATTGSQTTSDSSPPNQE